MSKTEEFLILKRLYHALSLLLHSCRALVCLAKESTQICQCRRGLEYLLDAVIHVMVTAVSHSANSFQSLLSMLYSILSIFMATQ